jgi:hypothetical protein
MIGVAFTECKIDWGDGQYLPVQMLFLNVEEFFDISKSQDDIQQSWDWPEKIDVLSNCKKKLVVTDFMARGLDSKKKIELFNKVICVFIEETNCDALYMPLSKCFRNPKTFLEYKFHDGINYGFFNIRFFNIQNTNDDMIMDSIGLYDFMLPDVQCHFHNLNPSEVAKALYNICNYILENGDVIQDGNTVQGINLSDKWYCQHATSILEPKRVIIDINPGKDYAAGNRRNIS